MLYKNYNIELVINGQIADLESDESLGIRFQNVLFDPEKIETSTAEYSFSFDLPSTPVNDKIFDYANNLSKLNKYRTRFDAELYADSTLVFSGTLTLNSFKEKKYNCNLVSIKAYSLEEIFGNNVLTDINNWNIDFSGVTTINQINQGSRDDVKFPFISYGAFQKTPYFSDDAANEYTPKHDLDEWNNWYVESFAPSLNMLETIKHAFNYKGYNITGDALQDPILKNIYMSTNLADGQSPTYNLGNPAFGKVDLSTSSSFSGVGYMQELSFPYEHVQLRSFSQTEEQEYYNFDNVMIQDLLSTGVTINQTPSYIYQPNEHVIVIPESGWYMIELTANTTINSGSITAALHVTHENGYEWIYENESITKSLSAMTPVEIALLRNYDDNYELIKGKHNIEYSNGSPSSTATTWLTCFPHEDPVQAKLPTKRNDLYIVNQTRMGGNRSSDSGGGQRVSNGGTSVSGNFYGVRTRGGTIDPTGGGRVYSNMKYGYMYGDFNGDVHNPNMMCYDQAVSPSFICGLSSYQGGVAAVMKNGYSWSKSESRKNEIFAPVAGYDYVYRTSGATPVITADTTNYNENKYVNCPAHHCSASTTSMNGNVACCVWLEKNDVLNLFAVSRAFFNKNGEVVPYTYNVSTQLKITAFTNRNQVSLKSDTGFTYDSPTEFPIQLNLCNFLNKETKISDFVQNVIDAYNLQISQNGKNVEINVRKKIDANINNAIDVDDRVSSDEAESSMINYPKSMAVKYRINTEEYGFEQTVPSDKRDLDNWTDYGDSGYTIIKLNDDSYVTTTSDKNLQFSYTWYDKFNWYPVDSAFTKTSSASTEISIPAISKEEYLAEGVDYDEAMKHDGYGLPQRFWFKPQATEMYVWTKTYPPEKVTLYKPQNALNGLNLSYKDTEQSLLTKYFNIAPYLSSNYVKIEVYLTADEYNLLKNGAHIKFDSDIYIPVELNGYDPIGENPTEIKMIKRV